ncbi:hypothetical protein M9Y10_022857 [Tritrichomonas musculus]|uniref:USP domain-containing protein n=1 Tax=Tritrichomonas musculus TaxID=1915356 RepID=A0ABR2KUD4_9EUKA
MNENDEKSVKTEIDNINTNKTLEALSQIGVGLRGMTNTCSINTILQVLFHINIFRHHTFYLRQSRVSNSLIALEIQKIFIQLAIKGNTPPSTKELLFKMKITHEELAKNNDPILYLHKLYNIFKNDDFFRNLFIGCVSKNHKNAYFLSLSLNVELGDDIETIFYGMYSYLRFDRLPPVIFINLDRYHNKYVNHKTVSYPKNLNLGKYTTNNSSPNYELYSVIIHSGKNKNGHFSAYIHDINSGNWVLYDDSKANIVSPHTAIEENYGGNDKPYSAKILVYFDSSMKDVLFEPDNEDSATSLIVSQFKAQEEYNKSSSINVNEFNRQIKINVVQVEDVNKYVNSESNIKFISDMNIYIRPNDTVKELYHKMSNLLKVSSDKLTIWVIFHSVPCLKLQHNYDNEKLGNVFDPLRHVQFFVEALVDDSEEEEEEEESYDENKSEARKNTNKNKKKAIEKEKAKDEASNNDENSILIFLFTYNYMSSRPLGFLGTVLISFDENIESLFEMSRKNCGIKGEMSMIAFQLIDSKLYLIPDPLRTVGSLELTDGSIIVVQPDPNLVKGNNASRPKKPKSAHGIFTYCPDYISTLPHSFSVYYEYRKDPYNLPVKFNKQTKMIQFPKGITGEDFKNFVLKAFDMKANESFLFFTKNSTKAIEFIPSLKIGDQLDLSQLYLVKVLSNKVNKYKNMIRLRIKMLPSTPIKSLTEFFDKQMQMIDVVNEVKIRHSDLSNYFILPLNEMKEIIPENFAIENIKNPVYMNLRLLTEIYITMILIVNGKEIKEIDIRVEKDDTFLDFKNNIHISNIKDARFYTIDDNGCQRNINDSQLMKKFSHNNKRIIYFETSSVPSFVVNRDNKTLMIIRPLTNIDNLSYSSQIYPTQNASSSFSTAKKEENTDDINNDIKNETENNNNNNNDTHALDFDNDHLLITDQITSNKINANKLQLIDNKMREKLQNSCQMNQISIINDDIHLLYTNNVVPMFSSDSQLDDYNYNKEELIKSYYSEQRNRRNASNITATTDDDGDTQNEPTSTNTTNPNSNTPTPPPPSNTTNANTEEKRGRGRPKKHDIAKNEAEEDASKNHESKKVDENTNDKKETNKKNYNNSESTENSQTTVSTVKKTVPAKKIQVEEPKIESDQNDYKNEDESSKFNYRDFQSDGGINYDDDDDEDDDDDDIVDYDINIDDDEDYDIGYNEDDEDDDNYSSKKFKKQAKGGKKKKKRTEEKSFIPQDFTPNMQLLPGSMNRFLGNNNGSYFHGNPLLLSQQAAALVGKRPHIHQRLQNTISSYQADNSNNNSNSNNNTANQSGNYKNNNFNNEKEQFMKLINGQNNAPLIKKIHNKNENSNDDPSFRSAHKHIISSQDNAGNKIHSSQLMQLNNNSLFYPAQQRREMVSSISPYNHVQENQEIQSDGQQQLLMQMQHSIKQSHIQQQPNQQSQQQQQNFKGSQQVINSLNIFKNQQHISQPSINSLQHQLMPSQQNQSQQSQFQAQQQQQQQQQQQNQHFPQPQIRSQAQNSPPQQQSNVQVFSYGRQQTENQQHNYSSNTNNNDNSKVQNIMNDNSMKKRPFKLGSVKDFAPNMEGSNMESNSNNPINYSNIDDIINSQKSEDFYRNKFRNEQNEFPPKTDSNQNLNMLSNQNLSKNRSSNRISITACPIMIKKQDNDNCGFIRDPASYKYKNKRSSTDSYKQENEFSSDAGSILHFPSTHFMLYSFKLMPTREFHENDENSRNQRDQNNRNRQNDPSWSHYSRNSEFGQSNDDFLHPL